MGKKVRLLNGKPLMVGGKVALSDTCCCGTENCLPGTNQITIEFSGITVACGCLAYSFPGPQVSINATDIAVNQSFLCDRFDTQSFFNQSFNIYHAIYYDGAGCTGTPTPVDEGATVFLVCNGITDFSIVYFGLNTILFYSSPSALLSGINNEITCGQAFTFPPQFAAEVTGTAIGIGTGGTATITL